MNSCYMLVEDKLLHKMLWVPTYERFIPFTFRKTITASRKSYGYVSSQHSV